MYLVRSKFKILKEVGSSSEPLRGRNGRSPPFPLSGYEEFVGCCAFDLCSSWVMWRSVKTCKLRAVWGLGKIGGCHIASGGPLSRKWKIDIFQGTEKPLVHIWSLFLSLLFFWLVISVSGFDMHVEDFLEICFRV